MAATNDGWFPLLTAVEAQDTALVRSLLDDGADPDRAVVAGPGPPDVEDDDWIGTRPLLLAAIRGHAHVVEALLGRATLDLGNAVYGETAVYLSARYGRLEVLRLLATRGADLNLLASDGWSPLCVAAARGRVEVVRFLLENCAAEHLNLAADDGTTPTHTAAYNGHHRVLRLLVDKGADINKVNIDDETPAFRAALRGHHEVLRVLVDNNADINRADESDQTPTWIAARYDHLEVLRVLVDNNAEINRADWDGQTPAYVAAQNGHHEALRVLHRGRARINEPATNGWTPLHTAAFNGHLDIVYYLARHGADIARLTGCGRSALAAARLKGHATIITLLEAVQSADGWRNYVARMRLPYCLIRHEVARAELLCPMNEDDISQQGLHHFVFGARDEVVEQGSVALLRAAPDDVFAVIASFLGVRFASQGPALYSTSHW